MNDIQTILSSRHITKLIYIDDELGKSSYHDNVKGKAYSLIHENVQNEAYPFFQNAEIWEELFEKWWQDASIDDVIQLVKTIHVSQTNSNIANMLIEACPNGFPIELLAPEQFDEDYKKALIEDLTDNNSYAIVLIDFDLEGYETNGDLLFETIASYENVYCGIFSQTFEISDEINQWKRRSFNPNVYPISKKRFEVEESHDSIIQGIKNVIWLKQIESLKAMTDRMMVAASETLKDGLAKIDPATFDRIVIASSKKEGCWEFDFLSRIVQVYLNRGIKTEMKKLFPEFQENTNSLRDFHDNTQRENVNKDIIESIERDEAYDDIDYINGVYSAVSNGDIFQIGNKPYILLGQPCNLTIRDDGKRSYDLDQAFLLPLIKEEKKYSEELLSPFIDGFTHVAMSNRQRVSLTMLDLVVYNTTGEAIINLNIDSANLPGHEIMQDNLLKRYDYIKEKITAIKVSYDLASGDKNREEKLQLAKYFCRPFEMGDENVAKKPKHVDSKIMFNVKRIGRYKSYGAHILLQQFMSYMSRPDFPGKIVRC